MENPEFGRAFRERDLTQRAGKILVADQAGNTGVLKDFLERVNLAALRDRVRLA